MSEERNATQEPGDPIKDPSYSTNQNEPVPVTESADDLGDSIDPEKADSDEQLGKCHSPRSTSFSTNTSQNKTTHKPLIRTTSWMKRLVALRLSVLTKSRMTCLLMLPRLSRQT